MIFKLLENKLIFYFVQEKEGVGGAEVQETPKPVEQEVKPIEQENKPTEQEVDYKSELVTKKAELEQKRAQVELESVNKELAVVDKELKELGKNVKDVNPQFLDEEKDRPAFVYMPKSRKSELKDAGQWTKELADKYGD